MKAIVQHLMCSESISIYKILLCLTRNFHFYRAVRRKSRKKRRPSRPCSFVSITNLQADDVTSLEVGLFVSISCLVGHIGYSGNSCLHAQQMDYTKITLVLCFTLYVKCCSDISLIAHKVLLNCQQTIPNLLFWMHIQGVSPCNAL